jgi:hypothetical protein
MIVFTGQGPYRRTAGPAVLQLSQPITETYVHLDAKKLETEARVAWAECGRQSDEYYRAVSKWTLLLQCNGAESVYELAIVYVETLPRLTDIKFIVSALQHTRQDGVRGAEKDVDLRT